MAAVRTHTMLRGDRTGVPKHVRVREYVRSLLQEAAPGTPTPSERELVQAFGVARMTVRQALDALVAEGLLERIPGKGTFVADVRADLTPALLGFSDEMRRRGLEPASRTLLFRPEAAGPGVARALEIEVRSPVVHWRRLRLGDGVPMCVQDTYLPVGVVSHLLDPKADPRLQQGSEVGAQRDGRADRAAVGEDTVLPDSLYGDLDRRGLGPTWAEDSIDAGLATESEAVRLCVRPGEAVLRIARRALRERMPVEVSRSTYRGDRYSVWVPMTRQGAPARC